MIALFELLQQQKIKPIIAQRFPLVEARQAQELLGKGGVIDKIVLVPNGSRLASNQAYAGHRPISVRQDSGNRTRIPERSWSIFIQ